MENKKPLKWLTLKQSTLEYRILLANYAIFITDKFHINMNVSL